MFNNPFGSFHNTVAEAKEKREQLDRLLTISTPRERLLVAAIGLVFFILAGWLFLGSIAREVAVEGVLVEHGENQFESNGSVQAWVWVEKDVAPQIEAGMPASIELAVTGGGARTLDGAVAAIAVLAPPMKDGPEALVTLAPGSVHRLAIALGEDLEFPSLASRECRIIIKLGRQPPVALFGRRRL